MAKRSRKNNKNNNKNMFYVVIVIALIALGFYLYFRQTDTNLLVGKWSAKPNGVDTIFEFQDDMSGVLTQGDKKTPFKYEVTTEKSGTATINGKKYKFLRAELDVSEKGKNISHTPLLQVNIENDDYIYIYTKI